MHPEMPIDHRPDGFCGRCQIATFGDDSPIVFNVPATTKAAAEACTSPEQNPQRALSAENKACTVLLPPLKC